MSLSDGLDVIAIPVRGLVNILMSISLFGVPLGAFFVGAFIVRMVMKYVFAVESEYTYDSISRGKQKGNGE